MIKRPHFHFGRILTSITFSVLLFWSAATAASDAKTIPLRVGLTGKYPPFNFFDESGKLTGFDVEISEALCKRLRRPCEYKVLAWDGILAALHSRKIDAIIGSMAITKERQRHALFTIPYYESGAQLFVKSRDVDPNQVGFRIGVTLGTTYGAFARKKFTNAEVLTYKGDTAVFQDLEAGRLDGMLTDRLVGNYINQKRGASLVLMGPLLFTEEIGIPVRKDQRKLLEEINRSLREFRSTIDYSSLVQRYFGAPTANIMQGADSALADFDWWRAISLMIHGLEMTIKISTEGLILGSLCAILLCYAMLLQAFWIRVPALAFVDFIRATPFMIQLFAIYFGLPSVNITLSAWNAAVLAIAIHFSSYLAEILKVAYLGVPQGQHLASQVLGLTRVQALRHVIAPQMAPLLFAPALNTWVAMIKDSAIVSVISVHELTLQTQQLISATFRPIEFYAIAALLYALITYPLLIAGRWLERSYKSRGLLNGRT